MSENTPVVKSDLVPVGSGEGQEVPNLIVIQDPEQSYTEAVTTAKFLKTNIIDSRPGLEVNGKRYVAFTEWGILAKWYGLTIRTEIIEEGKYFGSMGVKARAEVIHIATDTVIATAEAVCTKSEPGRGSHNYNQIGSMAQTRAGSKAYRNAIGYIVELAGLPSTPAEEMEGIKITSFQMTKPPHSTPRRGVYNKPHNKTRRQRPPVEEPAEEHPVQDIVEEDTIEAAATVKDSIPMETPPQNDYADLTGNEIVDQIETALSKKGERAKKVDIRKEILHLGGEEVLTQVQVRNALNYLKNYG